MAKGKAVDAFFEDGHTYANVYFLKVDASGHSNIVLGNTEDLVNKVFDLLEETVFTTVEENRKLNNCKYATFWGWQGDGGLCVIYDDNESAALKTALQSALSILNIKLLVLHEAVTQLKVKGEVRLRIAVHRGTFTYKGYQKHGSIHSKDLNFVAHLEQATPRNCLTISRDVHARCPTDLASQFRPLEFPFEDTPIFLYTPTYSPEVTFEWISKIPIGSSSLVNLLPGRYSEEDKSRIIQNAHSEVIDLGTALRTCSQYLISTARPAQYRSAVMDLLERGVNYTCLILNPDCPTATQYAQERAEPDLISNTRISIDKLSGFARGVQALKGKFSVYLYSSLPYFATIMVDRKQKGLLLYAPYLPSSHTIPIGRADSPHLTILKTRVPLLFAQVDAYVDSLLSDANTIRHI